MRKALIATGLSILLLALATMLTSAVAFRPALGFVSANRADSAPPSLVVNIKKKKHDDDDDDDDAKASGDAAAQLIKDPPPPNDLSTQGYPFSLGNVSPSCSANTECAISFIITNGGAAAFTGQFGFNDTLKVGWVQPKTMLQVLSVQLLSKAPDGWSCVGGAKVSCSGTTIFIAGNSTLVIPLRIKFQAPPGISASFVQHNFIAGHNGSGGIISWGGAATSLLNPPILMADDKSDNHKANFEGTWQTVGSNGGRFTLTMKQDGKQVTGTYTPSDGTLQGKVSGNTLTLKWAQPGFTGTGTFTMLDTKPKTFRGTILTDGKAGTVVWNGSFTD